MLGRTEVNSFHERKSDEKLFNPSMSLYHTPARIIAYTIVKKAHHDVTFALLLLEITQDHVAMVSGISNL